jgi:hypothetical protein
MFLDNPENDPFGVQAHSPSAVKKKCAVGRKSRKPNELLQPTANSQIIIQQDDGQRQRKAKGVFLVDRRLSRSPSRKSPLPLCYQ